MADGVVSRGTFQQVVADRDRWKRLCNEIMFHVTKNCVDCSDVDQGHCSSYGVVKRRWEEANRG